MYRYSIFLSLIKKILHEYFFKAPARRRANAALCPKRTWQSQRNFGIRKYSRDLKSLDFKSHVSVNLLKQIFADCHWIMEKSAFLDYGIFWQ